MNTYEIIKELAKRKKMSIRQLEITLGYSNGYFSKWKKVSPNSEGLQKVADYFDVSVDYLLGRTEKKKYYDLTDKDERSIQKQLQSLIDDLSNDGALAFSKEDGEMSEETKEALISSLENALRISKIEAKKKYTPKKYRS
ncbi:helix-turn-helix transcriptional regulator [Enterococcus faecalis]|uniref:helix-turn-helix domain-containing protein n=1 Tax=Enterococcus TaxID=1350 RepID=UPI00032FE31A|nr:MULTISPECIES: helix-turn-helix transcriptional regulator [Enterococcus]EGO8065840.1 helix-turn-helix transcriptional regulator [Enterococcus faecalis]EKL7633144.1 helix-turn-helix transcriptional regulator [Enterococcus faecalis]EOK37758.1 helix-turn-helix protein [Enterococcus faecalis EnGen0335]EOK41057.1 helix-turn-helix protein [Enterococcus faecalis EnGen0332]EOL89572.1 helix-turn-helix protein [Enterococcus faecalis EnGen0366]